LNADVIAVDCEFSGLRYRHPLYPRTSGYDLDQEIYERFAHVAERYCLFQVGVTSLKLTKDSKAYTQQTYSFFLHQQGEKTRHNQSNNMNFLTRMKYDWGLTY
jgi:CAF1 family ribonuclease